MSLLRLFNLTMINKSIKLLLLYTLRGCSHGCSCIYFLFFNCFKHEKFFVSRSLLHFLFLNARTSPVWMVAAYLECKYAFLGVWNRAFIFNRPVDLVSWDDLALSRQFRTLTENLIFSVCQTVSWPSHLSSGSWLAAYGFIEKEALWDYF